MAVAVANLAELSLREFGAGVRFGTEWGDVSRPLGGKKLGCGMWIVPPGKANVPYHYHLALEELVVVLGGEPSIRLNDDEYQLNAGDVVALTPGSGSAHQLLNRTDRPANLLMASTMLNRDVVVYPDSEKRMYWVDDLADESSKTKLLIRDGQVRTRRARFVVTESVSAEQPARNRWVTACTAWPPVTGCGRFTFITSTKSSSGFDRVTASCVPSAARATSSLATSSCARPGLTGRTP
jgi:uncharacterized cupin superfamily protein